MILKKKLMRHCYITQYRCYQQIVIIVFSILPSWKTMLTGKNFLKVTWLDTVINTLLCYFAIESKKRVCDFQHLYFFDLLMGTILAFFQSSGNTFSNKDLFIILHIDSASSTLHVFKNNSDTLSYPEALILQSSSFHT